MSGDRSGAPLIVALNPAIDAEWVVDEVRASEKTEVESERRWPGGKGINVARWWRWLGGRPWLFVPVGGTTGRELLAGVRREGLRVVPFPLLEPTRVNVIVSPRRGPQLRLNPLWPRFSKVEARRLKQAFRSELHPGRWIILSGALPKSLSVDTYAQLIRMTRRERCRTVLDCDGEAFRLGVLEGPMLVKPNEFELAQWAGRKLATPAAEAAAATRISRQTGGWVLVSLAKRGGLLVNAAEKFVRWEKAVDVTVRNTVGAGDALLAAVCRAMIDGVPPEAWLRHGLRAGGLAVSVSPGCLPARS